MTDLPPDVPEQPFPEMSNILVNASDLSLILAWATEFEEASLIRSQTVRDAIARARAALLAAPLIPDPPADPQAELRRIIGEAQELGRPEDLAVLANDMADAVVFGLVNDPELKARGIIVVNEGIAAGSRHTVSHSTFDREYPMSEIVCQAGVEEAFKKKLMLLKRPGQETTTIKVHRPTGPNPDPATYKLADGYACLYVPLDLAVRG